MSKALVLANVRYWITVAPVVRDQLRHWRARAEDIPDPTLRRVALVNLREEGFNAQATATLATLAPRRYRRPATTAIVALQILYDYLDSLLERPLVHPMSDGAYLFQAFPDAVALEREPRGDYYPPAHASADGRYIQELICAVRRALGQLPSRAAIAQVAAQAAERCAEAQVRAHAATLGGDELKLWARENAAENQLGWREFLAGAVSSGLALHALIALAAEPCASRRQAVALDSLYLSLCALTTLLDGLVDHEQDVLSAGRPGYLRYHEDRAEVAQSLGNVIDLALIQATLAPAPAHQLVTLLGIVAYYASSPTASSEFARPAMRQVTHDLAPAIGPILALMRSWRAAKRLSHAIASVADHR